MRILVLANGEKPSAQLLEKLLSKCTYFIATDGAGNTAIDMGYPPDLIIGDLDSYRAVDGFEGEVLFDPDQETNDLEKAFLHAEARQAARVDVLGGTGKKLDHTLKNLSVMQQLHQRFELIAFFDEVFYSRILPRDYKITLAPGHPVSLFPLSGTVDGIVTEGLRFPLYGESLQNGVRDGSSNEAIQNDVRIRHQNGALLFMTRHLDQFF